MDVNHMDFIKLVLTSLLSALSLFAIAKIMGHKQMAQLDFFDYINGITIGSIAAEMATELESPWKPFAAMIVYGIVALSLTIVAHKYPKMRKFINGTPTIIMNNGKIYRENMKKAKLELSEFMVMCRQEGYFNINEIKTAIFEYNGRLTILPKSKNRPLTPEDVNMNPEGGGIFTEVIMDGRILHENIKRLGFDIAWLDKQLKAHNYKDAKEIFLGICDENNNVSFFTPN